MKNFYLDTSQLEYSKKFQRNVAALQLLKLLESEDRLPDRAEQLVLANYVGWGSGTLLKRVHTLWGDCMTTEEIDEAKRSSLNAHYTSPDVVKTIWNALLAAGINKLDSIRALDPSAGAGIFASCTPVSIRNKVDWTEVDMDDLTSRICAKLHPENRVLHSAFEDTQFPENWFDLVISNFPFGAIQVFDKSIKDRSVKNSLHNYFFAKSLKHAKPGGIVCAITSRYTMDARDSVVRDIFNEQAELLAAVRLPESAFKENADTEVVTDLLIFRKRQKRELTSYSWKASLVTSVLETDGTPHKFAINQYFGDNPQYVLGTPTAEGKMYYRKSYTVKPHEDGELTEQLEDALYDQLPSDAFFLTREVAAADDDGATIKLTPRANGLMDIYKAGKHLLHVESERENTTDARSELNRVYDVHVKRYGIIHRGIKDMPSSHAAIPFLKALEPLGHKAPIFYDSTFQTDQAKVGTLSPKEAYIYCLNEIGSIDMERIGELCGLQERVAADALNGLVWELPAGGWVTAEEYLSGDVYKKIVEARAASTISPDFERNVKALELVQPPPIKAVDIRANLGAGWVGEKYMAQFFSHLFNMRFKCAYNPELSIWSVSGSSAYIPNALLCEKWGTKRYDAISLLKSLMNNREIKVRDSYKDGDKIKYVVNETETIAAIAKARELKDEFVRWLWEDAVRRDVLVERYNCKYNVLVTRNFNGEHMVFPGLNPDIELRPRQKDGAYRIVCDHAVLAAHEVGMGKTLTWITGAMESIRMGLVKKAMIVVPNHLVESWKDAVSWAYPHAKLLIGDKKSLNSKKRGEFMSTVATGNHDIIIVPISTFGLLPVRPETMTIHIKGYIARLKDYLSDLYRDKLENARTIKMIEASKRRLETKMKKLADAAKDSVDTITWEDLGVDLLGVDEFHYFKALEFTTKMNNIAGLPSRSSKRAFDMYCKSQYLLSKDGKFVGLTGTPITNTLAEAFILQKYFQTYRLLEQDLGHFDAWANLFAEATTELELKPDGTGFKMKRRFRNYVNVQELSRMLSQFLDVQFVDAASGVDRPDLYSGQMISVVSDGGIDLREYVLDLGQRADRVSRKMVSPKIDNMLKICSDGAKCATAMHLVDPDLDIEDDPMPKVDKMVQLVAELYKISASAKGAQLIFSDMATPQAKRKNVPGEVLKDIYTVIRNKLVAAGVLRGDIAFIHEAKTDQQKSALFDRVNNGSIRVLIGSTEKMGTGMNAQRRLLAVHHLTAPWRPSDIEQRNGRALRQGNLYPTIFLFVHITQGSFDGFKWQGLQVKAKFINAFMAGNTTKRQVEEIAEEDMSYAQIKALATGNPDIMLLVQAEGDFMRLDILRASWLRNRRSAGFDHKEFETRILALQATIDTLSNHLHLTKKVDTFSIEIKAKLADTEYVTVKDRKKAGKMLKTIAHRADTKKKRNEPVAIYRGVELRAHVDMAGPCLVFSFGTNYLRQTSVGGSNAGIIQSLDAGFRGLTKVIARNETRIKRHRQEQNQITENLKEEWKYEEEYIETKSLILDINTRLKESEKDQANQVSDSLKPVESTAVADSDTALREVLDVVREMHKDDELIESFGYKVIKSTKADFNMMIGKPMFIITKVSKGMTRRRDGSKVEAVQFSFL